MRKSIHFHLRIVMLVGLLALLNVTLVSPTPSHTPYSSALSGLAGASAGGGGCPNKICSDGIACVDGTGFKCVRFNGRGCTSRLC